MNQWIYNFDKYIFLYLILADAKSTNNGLESLACENVFKITALRKLRTKFANP